MKTTRVMAAAVLIIGSGLALYVARAQEERKPIPPAPTIAGVMAGTKRTDLQRHDLGVPGREVVQVRVELDPGAVAPKHSHPGEEIMSAPRTLHHRAGRCWTSPARIKCLRGWA